MRDHLHRYRAAGSMAGSMDYRLFRDNCASFVGTVCDRHMCVDLHNPEGVYTPTFAEMLNHPIDRLDELYPKSWANCVIHAGIAVAERYGAATVLLTDGQPRCLDAAAANFGDAHRARCSTALLEWGDEAAATAVATAFNPTIVLGADVGYDPGSHAKLIATLKTCVSAGKVAGELADLVLIEEARFRDVSSWLWDSIKQAGFMLVERVDLGGKVAYLRFKLDDQVLV